MGGELLLPICRNHRHAMGCADPGPDQRGAASIVPTCAEGLEDAVAEVLCMFQRGV